MLSGRCQVVSHPLSGVALLVSSIAGCCLNRVPVALARTHRRYAGGMLSCAARAQPHLFASSCPRTSPAPSLPPAIASLSYGSTPCTPHRYHVQRCDWQPVYGCPTRAGACGFWNPCSRKRANRSSYAWIPACAESRAAFKSVRSIHIQHIQDANATRACLQTAGKACAACAARATFS